MAQLINVRLLRPDGCPLGFRLQGGKDFGTPLVIQKVNGGSPADKAGLLAGDSVIRVNTTDVFALRHKEAQDVIVQAGQNFDITVQRGGSTWKPSVTPVGSLPSPGRNVGSYSPVTQTSLKTSQQPSSHIGSGYNSQAKPFNYMNGNGDSVKSIVNKQYNTPVGIYSEETIAETLSAQAEVLAGGVLGVNFKKNEKTYDSEKSEVFKMLQEADNDPEPEVSVQSAPSAATGLRHVSAPVTRPDAPVNNTGGLPPGQNICEECERLIIGVFVRIKDKNLHVECFKCATCGSSLKNQGYYNLNGKLYCDIHAKMVARQNPPAPNLEPVTMQNKPSCTFSSMLPTNNAPLPPLSNPIYSGNGPSLLNKSDLNGNLTDISLKLNQDNVDAFANTLSGYELPKENLTTSFNSLTIGATNINGAEKKAIFGAKESPVSNNLLSVCPPGATNTFKRVIPPHMGGNYKPSSNISGPRPFGAPVSPAMHSPVSSLSPRSVPTAPLSPASPALTRPSQQLPAPASITGQFSTFKAATPFKGGAGVGARGKTFGVSSAPKRGRGILNKAGGPGTRVPLCAHCNGHIRGPFITALGRIWCPEHFVCVNNTCRRHLQDIGFVEENGQLYCEYCFEQFIAPACDKCHGKIKGDCLNAIGKHFHPECFNCAYCGKLFGNNPFFLEEGLPYCEADWNELFTTKCIACGFPVEAGDRCAKRISRDRASTPREGVLSASPMRARTASNERNSLSPFQQSINVREYASNINQLNSLSPNQYNSGLFDDILSPSGKVLSTVTVDTISSASYCDVTDVPVVTQDINEIERDALRTDNNFPISVTDTLRTETFTNEDVLKIKLTPTLMEFDDYLLGRLTPASDYNRPITPQYITQDRINVDNSNNKYDTQNVIYKSDIIVEETNLLPQLRDHKMEINLSAQPREYQRIINISPQPREQFQKDEHLISQLREQVNLLPQLGDHQREMSLSPQFREHREETKLVQQQREYFVETHYTSTGYSSNVPVVSIGKEDVGIKEKVFVNAEITNLKSENVSRTEGKSKTKTKNAGWYMKFVNLPAHYHAAIICFLLVAYNIIINLYKQYYQNKVVHPTI